MRSFIRKVLLSLAIVSASVGVSRGQTILFDQLQTVDGISEYSVNAIYQDGFGRIWIATRDGLNVYDGKTVEVFRPKAGGKGPILGHNVYNVTGDGNETIYVHCMMGLMVYDLRHERFETICESDVERIAMGRKYLWLSFQNRLNRLDERNRPVPYYLFNDDINITAICEASDGMIYVGTRDHGLLTLDSNRKVSSVIKAIDVVCIFEDAEHMIWVGSSRNGLYRVGKNRIVNYRSDARDENTLSNDFVRCINQDNRGNYWIGTFHGLNRFDPITERFTRYYHSDTQSNSLGDNSIWCITRDRQGTMWIGSFYGCVNKFNPDYLFDHYYTPGTPGKGLCGKIIGSVAEDERGNLWVCSENSGLNYLDRSKDRFSWFLQDKDGFYDFQKGALKDILYDRQERCLWICTHLNGLHRMDLASGRIERINFTANPPGNDFVRRILPYGDKLILGTHNSVYLFDKRTRKAEPLVDNRRNSLEYRQIWDMLIDRQGRLWFSTSSEIYCYTFETGALVRYNYDPADPNSLQEGNLYVFAEDADGRLWIGSAGGGIALFDEHTRQFRHFDTSNSGLLDDYVLGMVETPMGNLLVATNKGLSCFDHRNGLFHHCDNSYPMLMLSERPLHRLKSGEIVICSINGMLIADEEELSIKSQRFPIHFSKLYVNNTEIRPGDDSGILREVIEYTDTIRLGPKHTTLRLDFTVPNYVNALQPAVEYRLEGFNETWVPLDLHDNINFTNLAPGHYRLIVRCRMDATGEESSRAELHIFVRPPLYKTIGAYVFYVLFFLTVLVVVIRAYTNHIRLKSSLDSVEREKRYLQELNEMKLNFFANISHELKTPLTLITSQLEAISRQNNLPAPFSKKILNVLRNTDKMNRLIGEILDFQKQENQSFRLHLGLYDLVSHVREVCVPFREYAVSQGVLLHIVSRLPDNQSLPVRFDKVQFEKVLYNLLSNAFKATKAGGTITVSVSREEDRAVVRVQDTGYGIAQENLHRIFDRFYQEKVGSWQSGSGIGLALTKGIVEAHGGTIRVESKPNEGALFIVSLPLESVNPDSLRELASASGEIHNVVEDDRLQAGQEADNPEGNPHMDADTTQESCVAGTSVPLLPMGGDEPATDGTDSNDGESEKQRMCTILIVEDNEELLGTLAEIFSPFYHVITASNGAEGLQLTESRQPDLVLSDVMMPVMDGVEMCKKIKSNFNTCHIPVVLLTARGAVEHIVFGLQHAADDYILKPFNITLLLARCNNIIKNRLALQAHYMHSPQSDIKQVATNLNDQELLGRAVKLIEENLDNAEFDIDTFAREMCLGRSNLFRKIKGVTGQTPNEFIVNIRLKKSLALLKKHPDMPVYQIAMMVGFNEDTYFMRCFKKAFGKTPSQYRAEISGQE